MKNVTPKIYVACLASYNSGILYGTWIDCAGKDGHEIQVEIDTMLSASPAHAAEEWAIHDHEGFCDLIGEHLDLDDIAELATALEDGGEHARIALSWLVKDCGYRLSDALLEWDNVLLHHGTALDYAYTLVNECYGDMLAAMGNMANYFNYESLARDLKLSGDIATIDLPGVYHQVTITNASEF